MTKSLFVKGADFVAALVFMLPSTNLVIDLGVLLVVLMKFQFAASEFVGGAIMIALFALVGGPWLRGKLVVEATTRLASDITRDPVPVSAEDVAFERGPWMTKLRSKSGRANAATYAMVDLTMLRRELAIGFTVAGFFAVMVPAHAWNAVFPHGNSGWIMAENVVEGPLVAVLGCVCSIGNVPLAAALWKGGICFGGVVAFIFADQISFPVLLVYRRYYGTRLMLKMLAMFWLVMSVAGAATEVTFRADGPVSAARAFQVVPPHFSWEYTTYPNILFIVIFAVVSCVYRNRGRWEVGGIYALDPVCGMQVEVGNAPAFTGQTDTRYYLRSDRCCGRFEAGPVRYAAGRGSREDKVEPKSVPVFLDRPVKEAEGKGS
jgi:uncharacterized membrane protein YraQ (UPF0718 family)/YHS domain-containing protein